jgi:hypothetical protein
MNLWTLALLLPPLAAACLVGGTIARAGRADLGDTLLRLAAIVSGLLMAEAAVLTALVIASTVNPPARRLAAQLRKDMPLGDVRKRAIALGFAWRVGAPRHVICHSDGRGRALCENLDRARSFGAMFSSASCDIVFKGQAVEAWWFYMD